MLSSVLVTIGAYLIGSLSFAVIVSRAMGLSDPRTYGSGNPGATNVLRSGSKPAAIVTLLLDAAKGWLPVMLVKWFGPAWDLSEGAQALAGLAAFLGHLYPVFFAFKGGKGVATAVGVLLAFEPLLALATLVTFAIIVFFSRYVSLASMVAAVFAPAYYLIGDGVAWTASGAKTLALIAMGLLLIWRHRENIRRLLAGTESKLGARKK
ncbi:glycerol-3-phosphate 1-O-acyltransferase PlsY [Ottowia beijingensis]|uniref:glycerol-3-phosphate 1-O-acyltransferase PlsY n=1 Tax=Ottowia beijingensis TaxID=1207057 RepID=UPI002FDB754C